MAWCLSFLSFYLSICANWSSWLVASFQAESLNSSLSLASSYSLIFLSACSLNYSSRGINRFFFQILNWVYKGLTLLTEVKNPSLSRGSSPSSSNCLFILNITSSFSSLFNESRSKFSSRTVLSLLWKNADVHKFTKVFCKFYSVSSTSHL